MVVVVNIAIISSGRAYSGKLVATLPQIDLQAQFLRKQTQDIPLVIQNNSRILTLG